MKQLIMALRRIGIEIAGCRDALMLIARNVRTEDHWDTMPDVVKEKATALYLEARAAALKGIDRGSLTSEGAQGASSQDHDPFE